jgi:ATP-binding cassette, subfamily B, bacterial
VAVGADGALYVADFGVVKLTMTATAQATARRFNREWLNKKLFEGRDALHNVGRAFGLVWQAHRAATLTMAALTVVSALIPAAQAYVGKLIVDAVVAAVNSQPSADEALRSVLPFLIAEFVLIMTSAAISQVRTLAEHILHARYNLEINSRIIRKALSLDLSHFENAEYYDKMTNARNEADWRALRIVNGGFSLVENLITLLSYAVLLLRFNPWIALILFGATIPSFLAQSHFSELSFRLLSWRAPEARQMQYFEQLLTNDGTVKEVKLFGLGDALLKRYISLFWKFLREDQSIAQGRSFTAFGWGLLSTASYYLSYAWIVLQAVTRAITLGDMTLYLAVFRQSQGTFAGLFDGIRELYENALFMSNLFSFLELEPQMVHAANPKPVPVHIQRGIEFRDVGFQYAGAEAFAVRHVNFCIHPGEKLALVGANGAGKTTLIKLLTRLYDPTEGQILLDGVDLRDYNVDELRQRIGVIFQDYVRYQLTVSDNIGFGQIEAVEDRPRIVSASERSGAHPVVTKLVDGYETQLGRWFRKGRELSGGEWQKIALARAFMRDSEVLVLDEPTAALDAENEAAVFAKFRELTQGKMAVLISHRFSTVRMADRIAVVADGTISELGTHAELLALNGTYAHLFTLQAAGYR